jgi:hypothetical protein
MVAVPTIIARLQGSMHLNTTLCLNRTLCGTFIKTTLRTTLKQFLKDTRLKNSKNNILDRKTYLRNLPKKIKKVTKIG